MQKLPQKLSSQRTAKGPISISECCVDGEYIVIENTSKRNDCNMTNWVLTHCVGSVRKVTFKFPENFILKSKQSVKLWAGSRNNTCNSSSNSTNSTSNINFNANRFNKSSFSCSSSLSSSSSSLSCKSITNGVNTNTNNNNSNGYYLNNNNKELTNYNNSTNSSSYSGSTTLSNGNVVTSNGVNSTSSCGSSDLLPYNDQIENELILYDIENWTCGQQDIFIRLENEFGEEKACFRKTN